MTMCYTKSRVYEYSRFTQPLLAPVKDKYGGTDGIRTRVHGFADHCLTPRPPRQLFTLYLIEVVFLNVVVYFRQML